MKKIEKIGYVGKTLQEKEIIIKSDWNEMSNWMIPDIYIFKGKKETWDEEDWPPVKVKITIEEVK